MLSRSISSALKGKGKARGVPSSSNMLQHGSTPSILQAAGPSRAISASSKLHQPMLAMPTKPACTCSLRILSNAASQQSAFIGQKARLHGTAPRAQKQVPEIADLSMREYHEVADETMEQLTDTLEAIQEDLADDEFDIEYSSGVLTVKLPADKGTYVINKQPPNKQIWLSSPLSGPKRYDYSKEDEHWFYTRDGSFLIDLLEEELSDKLGRKVSFDALHQ